MAPKRTPSLEVLADADAVARRGARFLAGRARGTVSEGGRFTLALSGGRTPGAMLRHLREEDVPWDRVEIWQVDERIAPAGHPDRNLTGLAGSLPARAARCLHPMPVEEPDLEAAAAGYAGSLPDRFDLVHLGLGDDGHTASLVPGDPVLESREPVALTGEYRCRRRMTLTYGVLNRAEQLLWLVVGADKAGPLRRMLEGDRSIPAGRVDAERSLVLADRAAAG